MMLFYRYLFWGLVAVAVLQSAFYYPQLTPVVASHFDAGGMPDGWSSRNLFFTIYLAIVALLTAIFMLLPGCLGVRGKLRLNIPHRDYWLAPHRRHQTEQFLQRQMMILGIAHLLLSIYTVQLAILANLQAQQQLHGSLWWALGLYCLFLVAWLMHLLWCFRKP